MSAQYNQPTPITPQAVKAELLRLAEQGNKPFTQSLNPGVPNVLGIRIPHLRELAKKIAKGDWQAYLATADTYYMEERMLQGMVLGCIRPDKDVEIYLERVTRFVRLINSWSVCDTFKFGGGKRFIEANKERLWKYLKGWMRAGSEYEIRFGVVMAMQLFIDEKHIRELLSLYGRLHLQQDVAEDRGVLPGGCRCEADCQGDEEEIAAFTPPEATHAPVPTVDTHGWEEWQGFANRFRGRPMGFLLLSRPASSPRQ